MPLGKTIPLLDFAPDRDPSTPGVLVNCNNLFGTSRGLRTLNSFVPHAGAQLIPAPGQPAQPAIGSYDAELVSGYRITVAGSVTNLYFLTGDTFAVAGSGYMAQRWRYAMFGNYLVAVNGVDKPQVSKSMGPFHTLAGHPPVAAIVETTDFGYIFLVPPNSNVVYGSTDAENWAPSIALGIFNQALTATPGPITAFHRIRNGAVVYKAQSMYFGSYTGAPAFPWSFISVSEEVGCANNEAVVNANDVHYFLGTDDFWQFDGASLNRVPNNLREWFFNPRTGQLDKTFVTKVQGRFDRDNDLVVWHYPSKFANPAGTLDQWVALNIRTNKWTKGSMVVEDVVRPNVVISNELSYAAFEAANGAYDAGQLAGNGVQYDDPSFSTVAGTEVAALFDGTHTFGRLDGPPAGAFLTTGEFGDGSTVIIIREVRPIFAVYPAQIGGAHLQAYKRMINGYPTVQTGPQAWLSGKGTFNFVQTARSHSFTIDVNQLAEIVGIQIDATDVGVR